MNAVIENSKSQESDYFLLILKMAHRMANSADRDQTAPSEQSDLGMHCWLGSRTLDFCPDIWGHCDTFGKV